MELLGSLMESLAASWKLLGQPKRFLNDLDVILTPKMMVNLDQKSPRSIKINKKNLSKISIALDIDF